MYVHWLWIEIKQQDSCSVVYLVDKNLALVFKLIFDCLGTGWHQADCCRMVLAVRRTGYRCMTVCAACYRIVPAVGLTGYRCMTVYVLTVAGWYRAVRQTGYRCMTLSLIVCVLCGRMLCSRHWKGQNSSHCLNTLCASTSMLATGDLVCVLRWQFHILLVAMFVFCSHCSMPVFLGVTCCSYPMFTVHWQAPEVTMLVLYLHSIPLRICLSWQ